MWLANEETARIYTNCIENRINEDNYDNFRIDHNYTCIVGMSVLSQGIVWYNNIKDNFPDIFKDLIIYSENDKIGSPTLISDLNISPNTLRYLNTLTEILTYFKFDKNEKLKVVELGVGYGGLCFIMNKYFKNIESYCLIDLPIVQQFSKNYLNKLNVNKLTFDSNEETDLFISEFCLSEFDDQGLYQFYDKYLINSKNIYLHMNLHDEERKTMFLNRLSSDFNFQISEEFPLSEWPNYVIRGTKK